MAQAYGYLYEIFVCDNHANETYLEALFDEADRRGQGEHCKEQLNNFLDKLYSEAKPHELDGIFSQDRPVKFELRDDYGEPIFDESILHNQEQFLKIMAKENYLYYQIHGDSMIDVGIEAGDFIAVTPKCTKPRSNSIILGCLNGCFIVKRYCLEKGKVILRSENKSIRDYIVTEFDSFSIIGVHSLTIKIGA